MNKHWELSKIFFKENGYWQGVTHPIAIARKFRRLLLETKPFYTTWQNRKIPLVEIATCYSQLTKIKTRATEEDIDVSAMQMAKRIDLNIQLSLELTPMSIFIKKFTWHYNDDPEKRFRHWATFTNLRGHVVLLGSYQTYQHAKKRLIDDSRPISEYFMEEKILLWNTVNGERWLRYNCKFGWEE